MLHQEPGFINEHILFLGSSRICLYLVMGERYALLGGGVPWETPRVEEQLDAFNIDRDRIEYLVISHSHHDHCGAVPYLTRKYPHLKTVATDTCTGFLNNDRAVETIKVLNRKTLEKMNQPQSLNGVPFDFHPVPVTIQPNDEDSLDLGQGLSLQFYRTPGHTQCSLTTYVPELGALFPADAVPFPEKGKKGLTVTVVYDYRDYIQSLEKLASLNVKLVAYEHGGVVLRAEDAETIIPRSLAVTRKQMERIQQRHAEMQDLEGLIEETAEKHQHLEMFRLVPKKLMLALARRMVTSALGKE